MTNIIVESFTHLLRIVQEIKCLRMIDDQFTVETNYQNNIDLYLQST